MMAKRIQGIVQPNFERRAIEAKGKLMTLKHTIEQSQPLQKKMAERTLETYANQISKDKEVLNYWQTKEPGLAKQIERWSAQYQNRQHQQLSRGKNMDRDIDLEIGR